MCNEAEHKVQQLLEDIRDGRSPLMQTYSLSATQLYELDYKERKYVYVWPLSSFTLTLEEYGNLAISAQTWTALPFPQGLRISASGQANPVQMFVLCTDDPIDPTTAAGGSAVSIADGSNVVEGATTDVAVLGDSSGTISAKLRGLSKIFNDIWDGANHWLQVKVMNGNANGQATMANSSPVVLASDQTMPVNVGTPTQSAVSVGVTSTAVVTPGATAKFLLFINDSPNVIYLNISGTAAALNTGVRLNGNGGSILFDRYIPTAAITAISSVANSNLLVEVG